LREVGDRLSAEVRIDPVAVDDARAALLRRRWSEIGDEFDSGRRQVTDKEIAEYVADREARHAARRKAEGKPEPEAQPAKQRKAVGEAVAPTAPSGKQFASVADEADPNVTGAVSPKARERQRARQHMGDRAEPPVSQTDEWVEVNERP